MRLGIAAYVVPFVFALHPALILKGRSVKLSSPVIASAIGTFLIAVGCAGFLFRPLGWTKRIIMIIAGVALIPSASAPIWLAANLGGFVVAIIVVALEWKFRAPKVVRSQPSVG